MNIDRRPYHNEQVYFFDCLRKGVKPVWLHRKQLWRLSGRADGNESCRARKAITL